MFPQHLYSVFRKSLCTYKRCWQSIERTIVSKNGIKQLHILTVLHFNRCLTTEYSEITAHFNGNFDTDNQIYIPLPKCTATFQTQCILFKINFHVFWDYFTFSLPVFHKTLKAYKYLRLKMNSDVCDTLVGHNQRHPDSTVYFKVAKWIYENFLRLKTCFL
jgi:hypothetical protein